MIRSCASLAAFIACAFVACRQTSDQVVFNLQADRFAGSEWSTPVNLGPVVNTSAFEANAFLSANEHEMYFVSNRAGSYGLWAVDLETGDEQPLDGDSGDVSFPTVSELGHLAYLRHDGGQWSIRVRVAAGVTTTVYTSARRLSPPSWRPGGGVLIFGEQESVDTSRLWMALLAEPLVLKPLSDAEDVFVSRAAWLSGGDFVYSADGQLWRRGLATPTREPIHLFAASAVTVATAPEGLGELDRRDPGRELHGGTLQPREILKSRHKPLLSRK